MTEADRGAICGDSDIAWGINTFRSRRQLEWCLGLLRRSYPNSRVVIIVDGDRVDYGGIRQTYGCHVIQGEHLYGLETCDRYVRRILEALVDGGERYLIKIDPDTAIWRRLMTLPTRRAMFGTLETVTEGYGDVIRGAPNVQGGCVGMTADVAVDLLTSGLLNSQNCVRRCLETWARCFDMVRCVQNGRFCDDFVLSWAAGELEVPLIGHPEIRSMWRRRVHNAELEFAITHPHKLSTLAGGPRVWFAERSAR